METAGNVLKMEAANYLSRFAIAGTGEPKSQRMAFHTVGFERYSRHQLGQVQGSVRPTKLGHTTSERGATREVLRVIPPNELRTRLMRLGEGYL